MNFMMKIIFLLLSLVQANTPDPDTPPSDQIEAVHFVRSSWVNEHTLKLTFETKEHHKIYKESLGLKPTFGNEVSFKNLRISPLHTFYDKYSQLNKEGVSGQFDIVTEVYSVEDIKNEAYPITLQYQACSEEYCLFPQDYAFKTPMFIANSSINLNRLMSEGLAIALIFVFFAGFLTSLTPCIFPMIPLTMAVLIPRGQQFSLRQKLWRSFSYVLGIALTYSIFGLLAAKTGQMFGSILGNVWVALAIGLFFVGFGLSMLGFFEIQTPSFLSNSNAFKSSNTFLLGLAAGIIAGPCVGPVLLSILTYISQSGDLKTGFLLMMSFAFGMGLIFIVLGVSGDLFKSLPRSGNWLNIPKYIFAGTMFLLAIYYVKPVLSFSQLLAFISVATAIPLASYLFLYQKKFYSPLPQWGRIVCIAGLGACSALLASSVIFSQRMNLAAATSPEAHGWIVVDDEATLKDLLANGKPTVVDFYADWCMSCKELKAVTFSDQVVIERGEKFNRVVLNATQSSEFVDKLKKEHHVLGLPTLLFFDNKGQKKNELTLTGFESPEKFIERLEKAL